MGTRNRAIIDTEGVGMQRHDLYACVLGRVKQAIENGYNLEAITLLESIIADRLESICNELKNSNEFAFGMLKTLINEARKHPISENWLDLLTELDTWRDKRNRFLHEMAKIEEGNHSSFDEKYRSSCAYAEQGKDLFHKIDNEIRKYRNNK
jgi:uncharacterized protein with ParB-like and HNH nuclease domain